MANSYEAKDIVVLEGLDAVRLRPGMYIGTTGLKGLHHLLWEIVDNAIDEIANGFGDTISVILNKDGSATVKDNGRGIDHEQLPHIFEPFVTYKKNGTGLGLPLSLKIIKTHKGTINVSSIPHVLTTFTVTLPIKKNT